MAAPMDKKCALCLSVVKGRSYRNINSATSVEQFSPIFLKLNVPCSGLCCNICVNKLNRICTLNNEEQSRLSKIRYEREQLYQKFKEMPGVLQTRQNATPRGTKITKRAFEVDSSPTGATPKSKKSLFLTPKKIITPSRARPFTAQTQKTPKKIDATTKTKDTRKKFNVKVTVMYNNTERSKIITDKVKQSAIKAMMSNKGQDTVIKHLSKSENYKASMLNCVSKEIIKEMSKLSKRSESGFKVKSTEDLMNFNWDEQASMMQQKIPTLTFILKSAMGEKIQKCMARLVVSVCVLLYARCQLLNLLQFILGLVLDNCGLNKEGLNIMHDLGLAVSYTSIHKKRKELIKKQEENINSVVKQFVQQKCQSPDSASINCSIRRAVQWIVGPSTSYVISSTEEMSPGHKMLFRSFDHISNLLKT